MAPRPLEVYQVDAPFRNSPDDRPCVVLDPPTGGKVTVALISGQLDLYDRTMHFRIEKEHPDFRHTGLTKTCYVAGDMILEVGVSKLLRKRGEFRGGLADDFRRWIGL
jgi:hypothetical protein